MKEERLIVPLGPARAELRVSNSRFIASLEYAGTVEEAKAYISGIRAEFPDASHHVPAFVLGGGNSVTEFCSDYGEPSGTSGRPLLAVLRGSGLGNAVIVVTRYFGGALLGTGGLVKAYSEAGRLVIGKTTRATLSSFVLLRLSLPYHHFDAFGKMASALDGRILASAFSEAVAVELELPADMLEIFNARLADLCQGEVAAVSAGTMQARRALKPRTPDSADRGR